MYYMNQYEMRNPYHLMTHHCSPPEAFPPNLEKMTCMCRILIAEGFILSEFHQWGTFKRSV